MSPVKTDHHPWKWQTGPPDQKRPAAKIQMLDQQNNTTAESSHAQPLGGSQVSPVNLDMRAILQHVRKHDGLTDSEIGIVTGLHLAWIERYRRELVALDVLSHAGFFRSDEPVWRAT